MSDWFAIGYFILLVLLALLRPVLPARRRVLIVVASAMMAGAVYAVDGMTSAIRHWFPLLILLVAYYLSGLLFVKPAPSIEAALAAADRRVLGDPPHAFGSWPAWLLTTLDIIYLGTFLTVPAGLLALWLNGEMRLADHYWTVVMGSLLVCYAGTAVVHTRPPRVLEGAHRQANPRMRQVALKAVENFSIGINTIPSGHVAAPLAVGLALMDAMPMLGAVFLLLAIIITSACITGRYHFIVDCVLGAAAALAMWIVARTI